MKRIILLALFALALFSQVYRSPGVIDTRTEAEKIAIQKNKAKQSNLAERYR